MLRALAFSLASVSKNLFKLIPYRNFGKSTLNVTLANGLQSVQELASRFRESENHLIQILGRYIKDPNCQKELSKVLGTCLPTFTALCNFSRNPFTTFETSARS